MRPVLAILPLVLLALPAAGQDAPAPRYRTLAASGTGTVTAGAQSYPIDRLRLVYDLAAQRLSIAAEPAIDAPEPDIQGLAVAIAGAYAERDDTGTLLAEIQPDSIMLDTAWSTLKAALSEHCVVETHAQPPTVIAAQCAIGNDAARIAIAFQGDGQPAAVE